MNRLTNSARRSGTRRSASLLATTIVTLAVLGIGTSPATAAEGAEALPSVESVVAPADATAQSALLVAEDRRLIDMRRLSARALRATDDLSTTSRVATVYGYTLLLGTRAADYTVDDLLRLAPQSVVRMIDGSVLIKEHIVVLDGATLVLSGAEGLTLRLTSGPEGFSTIVSIGGRIMIAGEEGNPVKIASWDVSAKSTDTDATDGRAYIRAIGGEFRAVRAEFSDLGFWSGRTGGLALTGTNGPETGTIEPLDETQAPTDVATGELQDVTVERNAYALFVSGVDGVEIADSTFAHNLLGGVILDRYVSNTAIVRSTSTHNVGDGFGITRAATGIVISESTADYNGASGFRLDGRALAGAPTPAGASMTSFGNNVVRNSTATGNGRQGVEVLGGYDIEIQNNRVEGHDMGITVRGPAQRVSVVGNTVTRIGRHGIALVDGVTQSTVTGNTIRDVATGVYLRTSSAQISDNAISEATRHGVSLVDDVDATGVTDNVIGGSGASAVDDRRGIGDILISNNDADSWHDPSPWYFWYKKLLQPMSLLWAVIVVLVVISALRGRHRKGEIQHPYAHQMAHHGHLPIPHPSEHPTATDLAAYEPV